MAEGESNLPLWLRPTTEAGNVVDYVDPIEWDQAVKVEPEFSNDTGEDGVILLVDIREMGGATHRLVEVFDGLVRRGVTVRTRPLKSGDYLWLERRKGVEYVFPILCERKRADDLAQALSTTRFLSQKRRMMYCRKVMNFKLIYLFEDDPRRFMLTK